MIGVIKKYILPFIMIIGLIAVWISGDFLKESSQTLSGIFEQKLPFKVNPMRFGGEVLALIDDEINDNTGYNLPENDVFKNGHNLTDIISYKIHLPTGDIEGNDLWNIDLYFHSMQFDVMNPNKFDLIKGTVYIDLDDNTGTGSNISITKAENIIFPSNFNWDYSVVFDYLHKDGVLFSYSTKKTYPVHVSVFEHENKIRLGIPIVERIKKKMDKKYMGKHIVCTGFYSQFDEGNLIQTENISPYFDFVASSVNEDNGKLLLTPVVINNYSEKNEIKNLEKIIAKLKNLKKEEYDSNYSVTNKDLKKAIDLYNDKKYDSSEEILLKYETTSSIANTYIGVITALKAGDNSVGVTKQVELVHLAYDYFDKAEKLVKDDTDLYKLLVNRIGVSVSVPDEIFGKMSVAEKDAVRLLSLNLTGPEKAEYNLILLNIYQGKNDSTKMRLLIEDIKNDFD